MKDKNILERFNVVPNAGWCQAGRVRNKVWFLSPPAREEQVWQWHPSFKKEIHVVSLTPLADEKGRGPFWERKLVCEQARHWSHWSKSHAQARGAAKKVGQTVRGVGWGLMSSGQKNSTWVVTWEEPCLGHAATCLKLWLWKGAAVVLGVWRATDTSSVSWRTEGMDGCTRRAWGKKSSKIPFPY